MLNKKSGEEMARHPMQLAKTAGFVLILFFLISSAGRAGLSSLLSAYAARSNQLAAAEAALGFTPRDPDAHYLRGSILEANDDLSPAIAEYTQAVSLRPDDYVLWLSLAHARELNGDSNGAIAAGNQAVQLAPYYAQPHWQLGNLLVRAGRQDEGFNELRLAGASDPTLLPSIIDLAWQLSRGDPAYVTQAIQPNIPEAYLALAEYFKKRGKVAEAVALIRSAGSAADDYRRRYLDELIIAKRFQDAYALWSMTHPATNDTAADRPNLAIDSGFEQESDLDEPGFGWRAKKSPGLVLSLDDSNPKEGKSSLRIDFKGDSDPSLAIISQLVMVEPRVHYQLHFAARSEEIVSGGLPGLTILDAGTQQALGQSGAFPLASDGWRDYTFDFTVPETTSTIQITLQREHCNRSPCPIFGRLWLDNFSLKKM
ncbi:MAG TPA: hypothetical protein VN920_16120 [Pyrinomonadaceae bacterium]|nr:hypothetical protein [Pyrinomonadaceae bacterium]